MDGQAKHTDQRNPARRPALMRGSIVVPRSGVIAECKVRDFCTAGAKLELHGPDHLPPVFWLRIEGDQTLHYCTAKWHSSRQVGVEFTREKRLRSANSELLALQRSLSWHD